VKDAVLKLWDINKAVIIQTLSLHFPAFNVLGKEVSSLVCNPQRYSICTYLEANQAACYLSKICCRILLYSAES
jgi:hypothetical protein